MEKQKEESLIGCELCTMIPVSYSVKTGIPLIIKASTPY